MPTFDFMCVYLDGSRIVAARAPHDSPEHWRQKTVANSKPRQQVTLTIDDAAGVSLRTTIFSGGSSAGMVWMVGNVIKAVGMILSGKQDSIDRNSVGFSRPFACSFLPDNDFNDLVTKVPRPCLILMHCDQLSFSNRAINTVTVGVTMGILDLSSPLEKRPPLQISQSDSSNERAFSWSAFFPDGSLAKEERVGLSSFRLHPSFEKLLENFEERLADVPERFEEAIAIDREIRASVSWRAFGQSAATAEIAFAGGKLVQSVLLLSGIDPASDDAALAAWRAGVEQRSSSTIWIGAFGKVQASQRPAMFTALPDTQQPPASALAIGWCLAAALFKRQGVL